jgi:hypothetical protein
MKVHFTNNSLIEIGDLRFIQADRERGTTSDSVLFTATPEGWSSNADNIFNLSGEGNSLFGFPLLHWEGIQNLRLPDKTYVAVSQMSRNGCIASAPLSSLLVAIERLNVWKSIGITPDTPEELLRAMNLLPCKSRPGISHEVLYVVLQFAESAKRARLLPYTQPEKERLNGQHT